MRHLFGSLAAAGAVALITAVPAGAHATLEKAEAAAGSYKAVLRVPHGCDGQATHTVRVEVPEGYIGVKPMPKAGWVLDVESGDYAKTYSLHGREMSSGTRVVTWSGGQLEDGHYDEFILSGSLSGVDAGQALYFVTTQLCADGEVAWKEMPAEGQDPHELEQPAPRLVILAAGKGGHGGHGAHAGMDATVTAGDLEISSAWARAMLPNQPAGGGYLTIANHGAEADRLVGASSPAAAKVEIHTMEIVNDVMTMRPVDGGLEIPAGDTVELKPGGLHVMFMGVATPFKDGDTVPVTLQFEKAGAVEIAFPVRKAEGGGHGGHGGHGDHGEDHGALSDEDAIRGVLKATWDTPEAPLSIQPLVILGDHAVAGWMQDERGGRALMRRMHGRWTVHLCTGDAVKEAANLRQMGVPAAVSDQLATLLADAEAAMDPKQVALLSSFDGTVMMDGHGNH
ncbi:copper uptake system-associated protein [Mesorhizobium sp. Z1-4]|uniref:copper uptake system-associated protein n=1 Tax=Mesorhizobium sp. Z1-4 TaxID=2448478 RepID=UPI000FD9CD21